jgi:superfamily II DNA or RNA helicase
MRLTTPPDAHQERAINYLAGQPRSIMAYATGTGKSYCQLVSAFLLLRRNLIDKFILVGTVNSVIEIRNDCVTFLEHEPELIENFDDLVHFFTSSSNTIGIMKYGSISIEDAEAATSFFRQARVGVSFDEFHKLKNPDTIVSMTYSKFKDHFAYCFGVTATSITSKLDDLYHLVNFISPNFLGSYDQFVANYIDRELQTIYLKNRRKKKVWKIVGYKNLKILQQWMDLIMISFYPEYDFENSVFKVELSDPDPYIEAVNGWLASKSKTKPVSNYSEECDEDEEEPSPKSHSARIIDAQHAVNSDRSKLKAFREQILVQKDRGVLVYCTHYQTLDLLSNELDEIGVEHRRITGKMQKKAREQSKDWFNESPKDKVLFITAGGGQSLNLQSTNRLLFYDIPFGIGNYIQILGRVARYFSVFKTFEISYIVVENTIDEYKLHYIQHNAEPIIAVLGNKVGAWEDLPPFNDFVLTKLRRKLVWNK